jgi:hypothetical protein
LDFKRCGYNFTISANLTENKYSLFLEIFDENK